MTSDGDEIYLSYKGVRKSFNGVPALDGVDLEVRRSEIFGFIGPDGAARPH